MKHQEANDLLDSSLDTSINCLPEEAGNEAADIASTSEPEELGTTYDIIVGAKIEVYWP